MTEQNLFCEGMIKTKHREAGFALALQGLPL